jgi:hypothetical protein
MAIQRDEQKIGVQPSGRTIREFRTELPGAFGTQQAVAFGNTIAQAVEPFARAEASGVAREEAAAAPIPKDENGNYTRPPAPEGFGIFARGIYDQIVTERTATSSYMDFEAEAQRIRAAHSNNPAHAIDLLNTSAEARLSAMDPQVRARAEPLIRREVNQHAGPILFEDARRRERLEVENINSNITRSLQESIDLASVGTPEASARSLSALNTARTNADFLLARGVISRGRHAEILDGFAAVQAGGSVMATVMSRLRDGTLDVAALDDLSRVVRFPFTDGENVMGVRPEDIRESIRTQAGRDALANQIDRVRANLNRQAATQQVEGQYNNFTSAYSAGARGAPAGIPRERADAFVLRWAQDNGLNIFSPEGIDRTFQQFGFLPQSALRSFFSNSNLATPEQLTQRMVLFRHLDRMPIGGGEDSTALGAMSRNDYNFMFHFNSGMVAGQTAIQASENARTLVERNRAAPTTYDELSRAVRGRIKENDGIDLTDRKLMDKIGDNLPSTGWFSRANWSTVSFQQRRTILSNVYSLMATNDTLPLDDAMKQGVRQFMTQHTYDPNLVNENNGVGAIVPRSQALPRVMDLTGSGGSEATTTDYVQFYVNSVIQANRSLVPVATTADTPDSDRYIPRLQPGGWTLPNAYTTSGNRLEYGRNLALRHTGVDTANPGYYLLAKGDDGIWKTVYNYQNQPVILNMGVAAQKQDEYARTIALDVAGSRAIYQRANPPNVNAGSLPALEVLVPTLDVMETGFRPVARPERFGPIELKDVIIERPPAGQGSTPVIPRTAPRPAPGIRQDTDQPVIRQRVSENDRPIFDRVATFASNSTIGRNVDGLEAPFVRSISNMLDAMPEELRSGFRITSSYRSDERQAQLFADAVAKYGSEEAASRWVARPGQSNHGFGRAADLRMDPETRDWVRGNASRFGLHFPLAHEPWHIEPISARRGRNATTNAGADSEDWNG